MTAPSIDRSMATGPYPVSIGKKEPVRIEGSWCAGGYQTRLVGYRYTLTLSDGSTVRCPHPHGHKKGATYAACATKLVDRLNAAAGIPKAAR